MKKTLLLQTALVATAGLFMADVASAQVKAEPISVTVGGYMNQAFKVQDKRTSANPDQRNEGSAVFGRPDTEIWFTIRAVLDNGLRVGGRVELEGATYGDQIDESYAWFENDAYGRVEIGSTDRVSSKMNYFAPTAIPGIGTNSPNEVAATRINPQMWYRNHGNDTQGINVYTAANRYFGSKAGKGLMLGASYVPDGCEDDSVLGTNNSASGSLNNALSSCNQGSGTSPFGTKTSGNLRDLYQFGANYIETFGAFDVALFGSYTSTNVEQRNPTTAASNGNTYQPGVNGLTGYSLGTTVTYNIGDGSSVQAGGGFRSEEVAINRASTGLVQVDREQAWTAGVRYLTDGTRPGSVGVGVDYFFSKNPVGPNSTSNIAGAEMEYYGLGLTYQLAAGILLYTGVGVVDYTDATPTTSTGDYKQTFGTAGFRLDF